MDGYRPHEATPRLVLSNLPPANAPRIARALIEARAAACVNSLPRIRSVYLWGGEVVEEEETTLFIKTSTQALKRCLDLLVDLHPHEVPEVLVLEPELALEAYALWVDECVKAPASLHKDEL